MWKLTHVNEKTQVAKLFCSPTQRQRGPHEGGVCVRVFFFAVCVREVVLVLALVFT